MWPCDQVPWFLDVLVFNAIEDTIYHLHRALNTGRIDLESVISFCIEARLVSIRVIKYKAPKYTQKRVASHGSPQFNTTNPAVGCSEKRYSFYDAICVTAHISYSPAPATWAEASEGRMGEHPVYRDVRNDGRSNGFTILQAQH
jgi:hypothetical protein